MATLRRVLAESECPLVALFEMNLATHVATDRARDLAELECGE
jgi:hypothetical protein